MECSHICYRFHSIVLYCIASFTKFNKYVYKNKEFEEFSQALSKAASLSYTSGVADFDSVNNFPKEEAGDENRDSNSNLQQAKEAIKEAKGNLDRIIIILSNSNA